MPLLRYWTRQSQLEALDFAHHEYHEASDCFTLYLASDPPPTAAAFASRMLNACLEERGTVLDAIIALRSGASPLMFRPGVIRLLKSVGIVARSMQMLAMIDADETGTANDHQKNVMSMMDI